MVKTSPFNAEGVGLIPGGLTKIPHALGGRKLKKKKNRRNIVTNLINTLKKVHIKKKKNLEKHLSLELR